MSSDAILPQADRFIPRRPGADANSVAVVTNDGSVTISELLDRTARAAEAIGPAGRVLSTLDLTLPDRVCSALLGALAADGSLIQVTHEAAADGDALARIAADEGATVTFGVEVAGLARLA